MIVGKNENLLKNDMLNYAFDLASSNTIQYQIILFQIPGDIFYEWRARQFAVVRITTQQHNMSNTSGYYITLNVLGRPLPLNMQRTLSIIACCYVYTFGV